MASRLRAGSCGLGFLAQRGDAVLQRPQADPQHFGGALAIAVDVIEGQPDVSFLDVHKWLPGAEQQWTIRLTRRLFGRMVRRIAALLVPTG